MRVGQQRAASPLLRTLLWLLGLIGLFLLGLWVSEQEILALSELFRSPTAEGVVPTLQVDMAFADYRLLLEQRERALATGVVLSTEDDFLRAAVRVADEEIPVRVRLMEGPAVDLETDGKWPLEVRVQGEAPLLGLQRFYLQDPQRTGGEARLALDRALQAEGVLTARTRFVRVIFNGDDRGLYMLQEGLTTPLLEAQGRPPGVVVGFDSDTVWQNIARFEGDLEAALADPVLDLEGLHYLEADAFGDATIDRDPLLDAQRDEALALLHALQADARPAGEILDVARYARFLALVDLWGFPELASPLNVGFYLQPDRGRLEPVAFAGNLRAGSDRLSLATTYGDPQLQIAYVREASRVSAPEYLERVRASLGEEFDPALWDYLAERQERIRRSLNPVDPLFAYLADPTPGNYGVLLIGVANATRLPVEILGFDIGGLTFLEVDPAWLREGQEVRIPEMEGVVLRAHAAESGGADYVHFHIPLTLVTTENADSDPHGDIEISIVTRLAGSETDQRTRAHPGLPPLLEESGE